MKYFLFNKPFQVLSQFSSEGDKVTLASFGFPKEVYPVGRLDYDSEGLIILSDDKRLNHLLLDPKFKHKKTYWAQVENIPEEADLQRFRQGLSLSAKGKTFRTQKAEISILKNIDLPDRNPPIRYRKEIPSTWCEISITEGKNRQVRKMTAAINCPTLRLIRVGIENIKLEEINSGEFVEIDQNSIYEKLNIKLKF
jgi:23S rRNA pseudouridine2457 synthase